MLLNEWRFVFTSSLDEPARPALKTARLNVNQTRLAPTSSSPTGGIMKPATTVTTRTPNRVATGKVDCKCRPEEFTCTSSSSASSNPSNNSRRKGQLSFTVKVLPYSSSSFLRFFSSSSSSSSRLVSLK